MRFRFHKDFDHYIRSESGALLHVVSYKAGHEGTMPHPHIEAAQDADAGEIVTDGGENASKPAARKPKASR